MTRWLELAWADVGTAETPGAAANPDIVAFFADAGRPDIVSDEVSWCAAFVGACLARAGVPPVLPHDKRLLARAYLDTGTRIDKPRVGAVAVFSRGDPASWTGHVGFVVGETPTHIVLLGGNQGNTVSVQHWPKARLLGCVWPEAPKTPSQIAAAGSRTVQAARQQQIDAGKGGGTFGLEQVIPPPPAKLPALDALASKAGVLKGSVETLEAFTLFAWSKTTWIAAVIGLYFLARMAWNSRRIAAWRAEDASTGAHTGRTEGGADAVDAV